MIVSVSYVKCIYICTSMARAYGCGFVYSSLPNVLYSLVHSLIQSGRKETVLDLAKFVDKGVQVKLTGGRQGLQFLVYFWLCFAVSYLFSVCRFLLSSLNCSTNCRLYNCDSDSMFFFSTCLATTPWKQEIRYPSWFLWCYCVCLLYWT